MICRSFCSATASIWAMQRQRLPAPSHGWGRCEATTRTSWRSTQTEKLAHDNAVDVPDRSETMFQRTQDIRTWLPGTRHIDRSTTVVDWHRINFFYIVVNWHRINFFYIVLDKVLNELDYRFNASNLMMLKTICCFMPSFFPQFDSTLIKEFAGLYWKPMDLQSTNMNQQRKLDALDRELKAFANYITMGKFDKLQTMQDVLQLLECDYHDLPIMQALYRIAITIPVSSASPERSCFAMKRILNRLRASMGSQRLGNLLLVLIERELGTENCYNFDQMIDTFKRLPRRSRETRIQLWSITIQYSLHCNQNVHWMKWHFSKTQDVH